MTLLVKRLWHKMSTTIAGGAIIIGTASVLSRFMGLVRDNLLAKFFGPGLTLTSYYAAFKIPDFIFNVLILGALSASFIPIFLSIWQEKKHRLAWQTANSILNILLLAVIALIAVAYFFAEPIVNYSVMLRGTLEEKELTVEFMRVMIFGILFFTVSNVFAGILNSFRRFLAYSLAPIFYNVGIILGIVVFREWWGELGLAYGVIAGAAMHFAVQLPAVIMSGWRYAPIIVLNEQVKKIFKLMAPRSLALGITQINIIVITAIASGLSEKAIPIWNWADNLQHFPINVFGVSLALSAFPVFSKAFAGKDTEKFKECFSVNFRRVLFFIIPISIGVLLLRAQIVRLVLGSFGGGLFDWEATRLTAQTLGFFSISMFAQATIPMLARAFFAHKDTKTPVIISIIAVAINACLAWWLGAQMDVYGLALAFSIACLINMLMLLSVLRVKFGDLEDQLIITSVLKIITASLLMGIAVQGMKYFIAPLVDMRTFIGIFVQTVGSIGVGAFIYFVMAMKFNFAEVDLIKDWLRSAKKQIINSSGNGSK